MTGSEETSAKAGPVLFFDGDCGLCNRVVRVLLRLDRRGVLRFAPLQGPAAQSYLRSHGLPTADFDSLVFVRDWSARDRPEFLLRTDGALAAARAVGGIGRALAWLRVLPASWRDAGYRLIARWRYRIMGRWKPRAFANADYASRFLE
jgi:predicted DCC family thiol-disulfide oxidoreductase YuxK